MTQAHNAPPASPVNATPSGPTLFPTGEWETLQTSDREAARNIVVLMTGVFILGLIGYTIIALIV